MTSDSQNRSLAEVSKARQLIAKAIADGDAASLDELRRQAEAFQMYQRRSGAKDVADDAGEIKVRAEAGLGAIDAAENPRGRPAKDHTPVNFSLADIRPSTRANWRKLGALSDEELTARIARAREDEEYGVSTAALLRKATHVAANSGEREWFTPPHIIELVRDVMGNIDLDPASTPAANAVVGAEHFHTQDDDGLAPLWYGRVFLNPPYESDLVTRFVHKLLYEYTADRVSEAILLTNNATETKWFQAAARIVNAICFPAGRISYWHPDRTSKTPLQGQVLMYFGANHDRFVKRAGEIGATFKP